MSDLSDNSRCDALSPDLSKELSPATSDFDSARIINRSRTKRNVDYFYFKQFLTLQLSCYLVIDISKLTRVDSVIF